MELRPMPDIRLVVTCPQCMVYTRSTRRAITNDVCRSLSRLDESVGVLGPRQRVCALCHSHSRR